MKNKILLDEVKKINAIADIGLLYSNNEYDKERYTELRSAALRLYSGLTGNATEVLQENFPLSKDYPTAKVDIRGLLLSEDKKEILFVKESADGKWSLPGGWADVGYSPKEIIIKEFKEETGLDVMPEKLIAVFDKRLHDHPPEPFYVYKMIFFCKALSLQVNKGFDVLDVQYFKMDILPELSENRILKSQIELLYGKIISADYETYFD